MLLRDWNSRPSRCGAAPTGVTLWTGLQMVSLPSSRGDLSAGRVPAMALPSFALPSAPAALAIRNPFLHPGPAPSESQCSSAGKHLAVPMALAAGPLSLREEHPSLRPSMNFSFRIWPLKTSSPPPKSPPISGGGKAPHPKCSVPGGVGVRILSAHHIPHIPHGWGRGGQR